MSKTTKPTIEHVRLAEADAFEVKRTYLINRGWAEEPGNFWSHAELPMQKLDDAIQRQEYEDNKPKTKSSHAQGN